MKTIDGKQAENSLPAHVANMFPLHAGALAEMYGLSAGQVYYRLKKMKVSLRDIRNGQAGYGKTVKAAYTVKNCRIEDKQKAYQTAMEVVHGIKARHKKSKAL